ncbi:MAG: HD domain-containing protein [Acidobacteria bacterium]|nr:HD domain-containing protein [Acidobacteriota bacterium]
MHRRELLSGLTALFTTIPSRSYGGKTGATDVEKALLPSGGGSGSRPLTVAGVQLVDSDLAKKATELTRSVSPPYLFNHAVRTFVFGSLIGKALGQKFDEEVLYLSCILHDLGLTEKFQGDLPFEIQGAEAARRFLQQNGYEETKASTVWDGIAMHASVIGEFKGPEIALVGEGAGADVLGPDFSKVSRGQMHEILAAYPRINFKHSFVKTCADVVRRHPGGAGRSFMRDIGERYVSEYRPKNFCDAIETAPFRE